MTAKLRKIALAGNPNVGKSAIFGCLTGRYAVVSNYPGTTVEVLRARAAIAGNNCEVIDLPGLYSIFPITEEERVALRILREERPDVVVNVVDAKNLGRSLPLTIALKEVGFRVVLVLNMMDEAEDLGMAIDAGEFSRLLGVDVVVTVAVMRKGIAELTQVIGRAIATEDAQARIELPEYSPALVKGWHGRAMEIERAVLSRKMKGEDRLSGLDRLLISPVAGFVILALVLYFGLYKFVGSFGAGTVVDILEGGYEAYVSPFFTSVIDKFIPWAPVQELLVGEYGILTLAMRYALAIVLPIVGLFFLVFAVIEDSGYLPRLAYLLDAAFKRIGLSGRAVIPAVLGLGCVTMGTMVTRTLATRRERVIATLLLSLCIPCSAQMGVILGLLAGKPWLFAAWFFVIALVFSVTGFLLSRLLPGAEPTFIMEFPPIRLPRVKNVLIKTFARMEWYVKEVIPLFVLASVLIWAGQMTGVFEMLIRAIAFPLRAMGLPIDAAPAFIFGFFRRDYGAAGLYDLYRKDMFSDAQLLTAVVVLTLFLPCITQFLITVKERGWKVGMAISVFVLTVAFTVGVCLNGVLLLL